MTRNEKDLRDALQELDRRAIEHGGPSTDRIGAHAGDSRLELTRPSDARRFPRWLPPLATAGLVAAAAITVVTLSTGDSGPAHQPGTQAGAGQTATTHAAPRSADPSAPTSSAPTSAQASTKAPARSSSPAAGVLDEAAAKLETGPAWTAPAPTDYFYVHTNQVTTWTSVSGTKAGKGETTDGGKVFVPGCQNGHFIGGQSGSCTLNDVPHFRADAPTTPAAWDAYLEQMAPGAKAAHAQGKIIVQVLHQDLVSPKAAAALLRYTATCPGLHTVDTSPVSGQKLIGVTCTSMTNGSYGLAFDAGSHAFVGYVPVDYHNGRQNYQAEIIAKTGIVSSLGQTP